MNDVLYSSTDLVARGICLRWALLQKAFWYNSIVLIPHALLSFAVRQVLRHKIKHIIVIVDEFNYAILKRFSMNFLTPQLREVVEELIELRYKLLVEEEVEIGGKTFVLRNTDDVFTVERWTARLLEKAAEELNLDRLIEYWRGLARRAATRGSTAAYRFYAEAYRLEVLKNGWLRTYFVKKAFNQEKEYEKLYLVPLESGFYAGIGSWLRAALGPLASADAKTVYIIFVGPMPASVHSMYKTYHAGLLPRRVVRVPGPKLNAVALPLPLEMVQWSLNSNAFMRARAYGLINVVAAGKKWTVHVVRKRDLPLIARLLRMENEGWEVYGDESRGVVDYIVNSKRKILIIYLYSRAAFGVDLPISAGEVVVYFYQNGRQRPGISIPRDAMLDWVSFSQGSVIAKPGLTGYGGSYSSMRHALAVRGKSGAYLLLEEEGALMSLQITQLLGRFMRLKKVNVFYGDARMLVELLRRLPQWIRPKPPFSNVANAMTKAKTGGK